MDWVSGMNAAMERLEAQLLEEVDITELARMVGLSPFHFQTVFCCMTGVTLGEYVRRRRMSRAAADLQDGMRVIDAALKYGYQSPTAFNRAFRQVHGIAPSDARRRGAALKSYPPLRFQITIRGAEEMNYRIVPMDAFTMLVKKREFDVETGFEKAPAFWDEYRADGEPAVRGLYGVCRDPEDGAGTFTYMIGDRCEPDAPIPDGYEKITVPAFTWAVFEDRGQLPEALQRLNRRIFAEWLPGNGEYELAAGWNIEEYNAVDMQNGVWDESYRFALWAPVRRVKTE